MSHSKETPRQKMISMMYLVLTCLLAINVSREVLDGFVTINDSIEISNANFTSNTQKVMKAFDEAIQAGHYDCVPYYQKARQASALSQKTFSYVEALKKEVVRFVEDDAHADTMKLSAMARLDDFDRPTYLLLGSDETRLKEGAFTARELRRKLTELSDSLNLMLDDMKDKDGTRLPEDDYHVMKDRLRLFTPHDRFKDQEGKLLSWELKNFNNMPLAAVVTNLSKIQGDIRSIEAELVNSFAAASGKLAVRFNQMQARIVPVSQYVQAGSPYLADVFLSASSSDFKDDNLQFILGEVDTASGKLLGNAKTLPVTGGMGRIELPTGVTGRQQVKGWIKFREGNGNYKYFRYTNEYVVAQPAVAVSPDKMNVLYAGVDNPISVTAAGIAPTELVVDIEGCNGRITPLGNGKYITQVSGSGSCSVSVYQKTTSGLRAQGLPQVFRVKRIPNPPIRINNHTSYDQFEIKLNEARNLTSIGIDNRGFDFQASFRVTSFVMTAVVNGQGQQVPCSGNQFSQAARQALAKLKSGSKVYLEDIHVDAPDGPRTIPMAKITVK